MCAALIKNFMYEGKCDTVFTVVLNVKSSQQVPLKIKILYLYTFLIVFCIFVFCIKVVQWTSRCTRLRSVADFESCTRPAVGTGEAPT